MTADNPATRCDELVDEVRMRRQALMADHHDDLETLAREFVRRQTEHPDRVVDLRRATVPATE